MEGVYAEVKGISGHIRCQLFASGGRAREDERHAGFVERFPTGPL